MIYTVTLNPAIDRELSVSALTFDTVLRASGSRVDIGGKGFNVARQLLALGSPSVALGFIAGGAGELLAEGLEQLGIATDFIRVPGETRTNISIVNQTDRHYIKVNEPGPSIDQQSFDALLALVARRLMPGDWCVLAGSLPPGLPTDAYRQLIAVVNQSGAHAVLDSSGAALGEGMLARPWLAKPNREELAALLGEPLASMEALRSAARTLLATGPHNLLISLGAGGALWLSAEAESSLASIPITERNPIGAGDAMLGGLVHALAQSLPLPIALGWAIAAGAATAAASGTAVGTLAEVEALRMLLPVSFR